MSKRILACGDFTQVSTGYGVYMRNLLQYLHGIGYTVAELACACTDDNPQIAQVPWKVYPNIPSPKSPRRAAYDADPRAEYGGWQFEAVCLDFKPDIVIDIRDIWYCEFILRSPLRKYFSTVIMPAVDAIPQNKQWMEMYEKIDKVITYTQWAYDYLAESPYNINLVGVSSPVAEFSYKPFPNRLEVKKQLGFDGKKIIGMVGRNQKRKLFPSLFKAFAEYLKQSGRTDTYLYVHTALGDKNWELAHEIFKHGISHRTVLTYVCRNCGFIEPSLLKYNRGHCFKCKNPSSMETAGGGIFIPNNVMAAIYNCMDLYVQWATNEGYGIPQMEALACGVPTVGVGYSATEEVTLQGKGKVIPPAGLYQEMESGRMFACGDEKGLVEYFNTFFNRPDAILERDRYIAAMQYSINWSKNFNDVWVKAIEDTQAELPWNSPIRLTSPHPQINHSQLSNSDYAKFLIANVLNEPELLGTSFEARLIRDLNNGNSPGGYGRVYYHELNATQLQKYAPFDRETAYNVLATMAGQRNTAEKARVEQ